ncbi:Hsp70 family protein [Dactylosporangium sp. NPDC005572]|uniref:Hsp70 family protein n=1 Tax=Dactylosporangium sp. NPDC005572 TaxID=3156889 RepID=UPI0033A63445
MDGPILVVDFGTSTSAAALVSDRGVRLLKESGSGSYSWPSAVSLRDGQLLVGTAAERRKRADPPGYRAEFKRDLGQSAPVPLGEQLFAVRDLVAAMLAAFARHAADLHGGPVDRLLLTVPASYGDGDPRRAVMLEAGALAGFEEVELLAEPVAASLAPVAGAGFGPGDLVLVYDFGGGTFDTALVRFGAQGFAVAGHAALDDAGGRDIDALLSAHVLAIGGPDLSASLVPAEGDRLTRMRLAMQLGDFVRAAKHQLTDDTEVEDHVTAVAPALLLRRAELESLTAGVLARTVDCCRELLGRCGVRPAELTAVLVVGGTSRMPAVADAVGAAFGRPVRRPEDPDLAVVEGAAVLAGRDAPAGLDPEVKVPGRDELRWALPGGGRLVRTLAAAGQRFAPAASLAVARDGTGTRWRLLAPPYDGVLTGWATGPDRPVAAGQWLAATGPAPGVRYLLDEPQLVTELPGLGGAYLAAFTPAGTHLVTATATGVVLREAGTGRALRELAGHTTFLMEARFTADGHRLVTAGGTTARLWDVATGQRLLTLPHKGIVFDAAISPDERWMATAGGDDRAVVWDAATGRKRHTLRHRGQVRSVAFGPDGRELATADIDGVSVWDLQTGHLLRRFKRYLARRLLFSPAGDRIVSLHWPHFGSVVLDAHSGEPVVELRHRDAADRRGIVERGAFSPDGRWLAIATDDGVATVWDPATGERLMSITTRERVTSVSFSPDGSLLAVGAVTGRIWRIAS